MNTVEIQQQVLDLQNAITFTGDRARRHRAANTNYTSQDVHAIEINNETGNFHEHLFRLYVQIEQAFAAMGSECADEQSLDEEADILLQTQTVIIDLATKLKAKTVRDAVYKLALWRWDSSSLEESEDRKRAEEAGLSAFLDLVDIVGEHDALTAEDKSFAD